MNKDIAADGDNPWTVNRVIKVKEDWYRNPNQVQQEPQTKERLPQRFRYRKPGCAGWEFGVCSPWEYGLWGVQIVNSMEFGVFETDPWKELNDFIGDVEAFEWIDNDFGWKNL